MNYLSACRAERLFVEYRRLAEKYFGDEDAETRRELNRRFPEVDSLARELGVGVTYRYPHHSIMAGVGGNLLAIGADHHGDEQFALAAIDQCHGAAQLERRKAKMHLAYPWFWVIDGLGLVLRFPFLVLRAAGLPPSYEQTVWAHVVKVMEFAVLSALALLLGIEAS